MPWKKAGEMRKEMFKEIQRMRNTRSTIASFEDGGSEPQAKEYKQPLEVQNPWPTSGKEMGTSVLQLHRTDSTSTLNEYGSRFTLRASTKE